MHNSSDSHIRLGGVHVVSQCLWGHPPYWHVAKAIGDVHVLRFLRAAKISYFQTLVNGHEDVPGGQVSMQDLHVGQELLENEVKENLDLA